MMDQERARLQTRQPTSSVAPSSPVRTGPRTIAERETEKEIQRLFEDITGLILIRVTSEERDAASGGGIIRKYRYLYTVNEQDCRSQFDHDLCEHFDRLFCPPIALNFEFTAFPLPAGTAPENQELMYTALTNIDPKISPAFEARLGWLTNGFTFERRQLHHWFSLFVKEIGPNTDGEDEDGEDGEEEEEEEEGSVIHVD